MLDIDIHSDVSVTLAGISNRLDNARPLWDYLYRSGLPEWFELTFQTDGFGSWKPTSRSNPILRDTRRYFRSFTQRTSGTIDVRNPQSWEYGSSVAYGRYHEEGRGQRVRQVPGALAKEAQFDRWVGETTERWISEVIRDAE